MYVRERESIPADYVSSQSDRSINRSRIKLSVIAKTGTGSHGLSISLSGDLSYQIIHRTQLNYTDRTDIPLDLETPSEDTEKGKK